MEVGTIKINKFDMSWTILTAYVLTIFSVGIAITSFPNAIIGGFLSRVTNNLLLGMLLGSLAIWLLIDQLWVRFADGHIPIAVYIICFIILMGQAYVDRYKLTHVSKMMIGGEQAALIILCIYSMAAADIIRWF
jgi:hypothetical protein